MIQINDTLKAQWIWYPGDFELMLNLRVHSSRFERGIQITPIWHMCNFYPCIKFRKTFFIVTDTIIYIRTDGEASVELDSLGNYCYDYKEGIFLRKGEHLIVVTVFNSRNLPSIFIDNDQLKTDESWEVTCVDDNWVNADYWNFIDPVYPPSSFKLNLKTIEVALVEKTADGLLLDFGTEIMGYLQFENVAGCGEVKINYGESREEALDCENSMIFDKFIVHGDYVTPHSFAFRYIFLRYSKGIEIGKVSALHEYLPMENKGSFECESRLFNNIYDVSLYTLHLNSREFFLDGIKRDRWVWGGDACQSYLLNYYSFFDRDICKRTINVLCSRDPVKQHHNTIQDYTCFWFISLYDYYMHTGDREFIIRKYESAKALMSFCLERTDERGFMNSQSGDWVFVDWAPIDNKGDVSVIQLLYARSLEVMSTLAQVCGRSEDSKVYWQLFEKTKKNLFKIFWSKQYCCFTHGPASPESAVVTKYANIFALLYGYLDGKKQRQVIENAILNDDVLKITTPYMKFYELAALCEAKCFDSAKRYIEEYWGGMLALGATTFWETYNPEDTGNEHYAMYDKPYGKSLCHAWGAGPILLFGKYFLGVKPISAGYSTFEVSPVLSGLSYIKGKVPTPEGWIEIFLDKYILEIHNNTPGTGKILTDRISGTIAPFERRTFDLNA